MRRSLPASRSLPLAISGAVHTLAALLLAWALPSQPVIQVPPPEEPSLEVELVETSPVVERAAAVEPVPGAQPAAPPPRARPPESLRTRAIASAPPAPVGPASAVPDPPSPLAVPSPDPALPPSGAAVPPPVMRAAPTPRPASAPSTAAAARARPPLSLALDFRTVDRLTDRGILERPEAPGTPPPPVPPRPSTFGERLAARVRQDGARRNVAAGKVHPQVFDYMRDARKVFAPDPGTVDLDPRTPNSVKNSVKQWGGGLREAYKSWRRDLDDLRSRQRIDDPDRRGVPDILEHYNRILEGTRNGAEAIASQVCLLVAPGAPPRVELGQSSNNDEVDRAAIEALSRAARRRQPDPDLKKQRTCYRFAVKVVRVPPLPVAGCMFDEVELTASCYYPLKKGMTMSVSVDSVDYD